MKRADLAKLILILTLFVMQRRFRLSIYRQLIKSIINKRCGAEFIGWSLWI